MKKNISISLFLFLLTGLFAVQCPGQLRLPKLISDGMVLQRDADVNIWGWSAPNEKVRVVFMNTAYETSANDRGDWRIKLPDLKAGGPYDMKITAGDSITIKDILIGDVWVCSGQSQMDINMSRVSPLYEEDIKSAGNPNIRYFAVPVIYNFNAPQADVASGKWESISQNNILNVSAIAYFFACELNNKYKVPIGLIRASHGGSPAEAWLSQEAVKEFPKYYEEAQRFKDTAVIIQIQKSDRENTSVWYNELNRLDEGYNHELPWYRPEVDVSNWLQMEIPGYWADGELGEVNGVLWFRKDIDISPELANKSARLLLGRIIDADSVFVNGVFVGSVSYQYPPRRYFIPENILKEGKNTIVIRLISNGGKGGFVLDKPYELIVDNKKIDLKGFWKYRLGAKMRPMSPSTFITYKPTGIFNAMIAPLTNFMIKGVIFYQGESNTDRPLEYAELFPAVIKSWRNKWDQGDFPFLYVQLHNYSEAPAYPSESSWALTREAQLKTLSLPNTGMVVAIDLGEWNDIHPLNKKDVAKRLSLAARKIAYNEKNVVASGPIYQKMAIRGNKVILTFSNIGSGLQAKGGKQLKQFAIAGKDKKFVWANAKIVKNKVIVWSPAVKEPAAVRYAWATNPEGANLYNKEGLPASPFRTDDWPIDSE
ncbi:MAG: sialate O-acetylesterase [Bacteroidetes bacterium]|nr:sialate O-acetylesterase [Bacteroidota bacterium]